MSDSKPSTLQLIFIVSFASISAVLITPALPAIAEHFAISFSKAQLVISVFLIGYALGQLPYGPIANRYGRKKALYIGTVLAAIGSILCVVAGAIDQFNLLLLGRFIAALGASCGLKIAYTMIGDSFSQSQATKVISHMIFAFALIPAVGIAIGGFLTQHYSWQACFYFLAFYSLLVLVVAIFLSETAKQLDTKALEVKEILKGYMAKCKNTKLMLSAFIIGAMTSVIYVFAVMAPFIGIKVIGLTPELYGYCSFIPAIGQVTASVLARRLVDTQHPFQTMKQGLYVVFLGVLFMGVAFAFSFVNIVSLFVSMIIIMFGDSLLYANITAFAMEHAKNKSNASAVLNFINMGLAVVSVFIVEIIAPTYAVVLPIMFLGLALLAAICLDYLKKITVIVKTK